MRPKPKIAKADEVTITRKGNFAIIEFKDQSAGTTNLGIGPEIQFLDDTEILERYNNVVQAMIDGAQNWRPTEITEGRPQIKLAKRRGVWSAEGHVLRCLIESDFRYQRANDRNRQPQTFSCEIQELASAEDRRIKEWAEWLP